MNTTYMSVESLGAYISSEQSFSVLLELAADMELEVTDIIGK